MTSQARTGARPTSRASGRWRAPGTARTTPTSRCRSTACRPRSRSGTRPASTSATSTSPTGGPTGASCSMSGPPRASSSSSLNGEQIGVGKDSHLASEFDLSGRLRPGREHPDPAGREVVRCDLRRGPGPVVARWHHPVRSSCTPRATSISPTSGPTAGLADDLTTGTLDLTVTVGFPGRELPPGWTVEASIEGVAETLRAEARSIDRTTLRGWTLEDQRLMYRAAAGLPLSDRGRRGLGRRARPDGAARSTGSCTWHVEVPDVERWSAEQPTRYPLRVVLRDPTGEVAEDVTVQVGFRRVEVARSRSPDQRRPRLHPRRQPPRLRPAHRPGRLAGVDARRPRADEAVRVQRRPDLALPERPGLPRPDRRARPVRRRRGRHRVARVPEHAVRRPALPVGLGRARVADGDARQEPRVGHPVVARQRVRPRHATTTRRPPGCAATTRAGRSTTRARSATTGRATRRSATSPARCTRRSRRSSTTPAPGGSGTR